MPCDTKHQKITIISREITVIVIYQCLLATTQDTRMNRKTSAQELLFGRLTHIEILSSSSSNQYWNLFRDLETNFKRK